MQSSEAWRRTRTDPAPVVVQNASTQGTECTLAASLGQAAPSARSGAPHPAAPRRDGEHCGHDPSPVHPTLPNTNSVVARQKRGPDGDLTGRTARGSSTPKARLAQFEPSTTLFGKRIEAVSETSSGGNLLPEVEPMCISARSKLPIVHLVTTTDAHGAQPIGCAGQMVHVLNGGAIRICLKLPVQAQPDPLFEVEQATAEQDMAHQAAAPYMGSAVGLGVRGWGSAASRQGASGGETAVSTRRRGRGSGWSHPTRHPHSPVLDQALVPGLCKTTLSRVTTSRSEELLGPSTGVLSHAGGAQDRPARPAATAWTLASPGIKVPRASGADSMISRHTNNQPARRIAVTAHSGRHSFPERGRIHELGAAELGG